MKNGKRPTRNQKKIIKAKGLNLENWLVSKHTPDKMHLVHRYTSAERVIKQGVM